MIQVCKRYYKDLGLLVVPHQPTEIFLRGMTPCSQDVRKVSAGDPVEADAGKEVWKRSMINMW